MGSIFGNEGGTAWIQADSSIQTEGRYPRDIASKYLHMYQDNFIVAWLLVFIYGFAFVWWTIRNTLKDINSKKPEEPFGRAHRQPKDVRHEAARVNAGLRRGDADDCTVFHMKKAYTRGKENFMAVNDVTFGVRTGECFGFLGKNGAGKSTVMKMMTDLEQPSAGTGFIKGHNVTSASHEARNSIGYCPQEHAILGAFTGREMLRYMAEIKGVPQERIAFEVNRICEILQLKLYLDKRCGTYSGGNKRKLSLGLALIGNRDVAFLDEPSTGVDPYSRRFMWDYIRELTKDTAIILTTHNMEEGEALCSKIGIIVNGKLVCYGTNQDLKARFMTGYILAIACPNGRKMTETINYIKNVAPGAQITEQDALTVKFSMGSNLGKIFQLGEKLIEVGARDFVVAQITLEDAFLELTKDQAEEVNADDQDKKKKGGGLLSSCFPCLAKPKKAEPRVVVRKPNVEMAQMK